MGFETSMFSLGLLTGLTISYVILMTGNLHFTQLTTNRGRLFRLQFTSNTPFIQFYADWNVTPINEK